VLPALHQAPQLHVMWFMQADAQQSHASESKDPGFGGVASGAMPEPPEQPHEKPNQKTPAFHMEVGQ
jgi:hypothetical protein